MATPVRAAREPKTRREGEEETEEGADCPVRSKGSVEVKRMVMNGTRMMQSKARAKTTRRQTRRKAKQQQKELMTIYAMTVVVVIVEIVEEVVFAGD